MAEHIRPSKVLYDELKTFGRLPHEMAARKMLTSRIVNGMDSSRISREVVNVEPGSDSRYYYRKLQTIAEEMVTLLSGMAGGGTKAYEKLLDRYGARYGTRYSDAVRKMCEAISSYGYATAPYVNLAERITLNNAMQLRDKCVFCFMLFLACGVYGNAYEAAQLTEAAFKERFTRTIGTVQAANPRPSTVAELESVSSHYQRLGLVKLVDGKLSPNAQIYPLREPPEKTIIGSSNAHIMDVAADVSRNHLAIWYDGRNWVCQGMSSMNGTVLLSGATKAKTIVELPRDQKGSAPSPVCEIHAGDVLCVGASTRFFVTAVSMVKG